MNFTRSYQIAHITLQVVCEDRNICAKIDEALTGNFCVIGIETQSKQPEFLLQFPKKPPVFSIPETAQKLFISPGLNILSTGATCFLVQNNSVLQLDLSQGLGVGYFTPSFWEKSLKTQQEFLLLSLLWIFREHNLMVCTPMAWKRMGLGSL